MYSAVRRLRSSMSAPYRFIGIISRLELAIDRGAGVISARNRQTRVVGFLSFAAGWGSHPGVP